MNQKQLKDVIAMNVGRPIGGSGAAVTAQPAPMPAQGMVPGAMPIPRPGFPGPQMVNAPAATMNAAQQPQPPHPQLPYNKFIQVFPSLFFSFLFLCLNKTVCTMMLAYWYFIRIQKECAFFVIIYKRSEVRSEIEKLIV